MSDKPGVSRRGFLTGSAAVAAAAGLPATAQAAPAPPAPVEQVRTRTPMGQERPRVDGWAKVTGRARYGSDANGGRAPAHAYLRLSAIACGRITSLDEAAARAVPGVLEILTYRNVGNRIKPGTFLTNNGNMRSTIAPLADDEVHHDGQIVAVVVADGYEIAREAAGKLRIEYAEERPSSTFDSPGLTTGPVGPVPIPPLPSVGDAAGAFAAAPVRIDQRYTTPTQHHNPMEPFTTTCSWDGDQLVVHESSQNVNGMRQALAEQLGLPIGRIRLISPFAGGSFGVLGGLSQRTALAAFAARLLGRPVRLEATRQAGFTTNSYRSETRQRVRLAADHDGRLRALIHDGEELSSRVDDYMVLGMDATARLYRCPNIRAAAQLVHADRNSPGSMRGPAEMPYFFAIESAMDELAVALDLDPIELRRRNDTSTDPVNGQPFSSRTLMRCYDAGADAFGWRHRDPRPRSMRDGDWLIGLGCASAMYSTSIAAATARVTLLPDGTARVQTGANEVGQGAYTVVAMTAAEGLGIDMPAVHVELGDTTLPPAPGAGGSCTTASVCTAVAKACRSIIARVIAAAVAAPDSPLAGLDPHQVTAGGGKLTGPGGRSEDLVRAIARATSGALESYVESIPDGLSQEAIRLLYRARPRYVDGLTSAVPQYSFGAQFAEARVHVRTGEIRVPRLLGTFAAGRILNPLTARSQLKGGQIWGMSCALHEATEIDERAARYTNADLAEYLVPVHADVVDVQSVLLPEDDPAVNQRGIKGIGELGNVGVNAAVANAVFHATGVRVRDLPIRLEDFLT
jgi:xanthine dehydrogenase YagR molybdenum-binding subunit